MQITLNQDEIIDAIIGYVHSQIAVAPNQKIEVDLKAGRGENGFTATLDIRPNSPIISSIIVEPKAVVTAEVEGAGVNTKSESISAPTVAPEEPKAVKTTKGAGIFGKTIKTEAPAPLPAVEPESLLPQQDPDNHATMSSELDDASLTESTEEPSLTEDPPAPSAIPTNSIFKFAKG